MIKVPAMAKIVSNWVSAPVLWMASILIVAVVGLGSTAIVNSFSAWANGVEKTNTRQDAEIEQLKKDRLDYARMDEKMNFLIMRREEDKLQMNRIEDKLTQHMVGSRGKSEQ
jgi:hypothetical protein